MVLSHQLDSVGRLRLVCRRNLVLEWLVGLNTICSIPYQVRVDFVLLVLLLEEVSDEDQHLPYVVVGATETSVLLDGLLEHLDLITEFGNVIG